MAEIQIHIIFQLDGLREHQRAHSIVHIANAAFGLETALDGDVADAGVRRDGEVAHRRVVIDNAGGRAVVAHTGHGEFSGIVRIQPRFEFAGVIAVVVVCPGIRQFAVAVGALRIIARTGAGTQVANNQAIGIEQWGAGRTLLGAALVGVGAPVNGPILIVGTARTGYLARQTDFFVVAARVVDGGTHGCGSGGIPTGKHDAVAVKCAQRARDLQQQEVGTA